MIPIPPPLQTSRMQRRWDWDHGIAQFIISNLICTTRYDSADKGLDYKTMEVLNKLEEQSPDIGQSVHGMGTKQGPEELGAGDQVGSTSFPRYVIFSVLVLTSSFTVTHHDHIPAGNRSYHIFFAGIVEEGCGEEKGMFHFRAGVRQTFLGRKEERRDEHLRRSTLFEGTFDSRPVVSFVQH